MPAARALALEGRRLDTEALRDDQPGLGVARRLLRRWSAPARSLPLHVEAGPAAPGLADEDGDQAAGDRRLEVLDEPAGQELGQELRGRLEGEDLVQVVVVELGVQELLERSERAEVRDEAGLLQAGSGEDDLDLVAVPVLAGALVLGRQAREPVARLEVERLADGEGARRQSERQLKSIGSLEELGTGWLRADEAAASSRGSGVFV